jgi:membrane protein implicated in regulation of membrane protease activity
MESSPKKRPLIDKLLILGGAVTFVGLTVTFSPMLWMATLLAVLPISVMLTLLTPTLHLNIVEKQTEGNRLK